MSYISLGDIKVTIFGAGLMGGSMALALKGKCKRINAVETQPDIIRLATELRVFDHVSASPKEALMDTSLVILATPVSAILRLIDQLPEWINYPVIVMDLGSTKVEICKRFETLPDHFDVIGGHPMCGKEKLGLVHAEGGLFNNANFALIHLPRTSPATRELIEEVVFAIGAHPVWIDADTHDQWVAATSHLPYLLAALLTSVTPIDASILIGPGFRSATRLAATPTSMMLDVIKSNRHHILQSLNDIGEKMLLVKQFLANTNDEDIERFLAAAVITHRLLTGQEVKKL